MAARPIKSRELLIRTGIDLICKYGKFTGSLSHCNRTMTLKGLKDIFPKVIKEIEETAARVVERSRL